MVPELIKSLADGKHVKKTISGIRGIFGEDFDLRHVLRYGGNFAALVRSKRCVVGSDTRESGRMVLETLKAALMKEGINTYDLGVAPTPVVFREARKMGAGVVVTASHNPACWNGLKFIIEGRGINQDELDIVLGGQKTSKSGIGVEKKGTLRYLDDAAALIGSIKRVPRVAIDVGGGAAGNVVPGLLERLGCGVDTINDTIQRCNRGPDPTTDELRELVSMSTNADIGFAFDLDGDRLVIVKDGKKQAPDTTVGLGIAKAITMGHKKFVLSIDSSMAIERFITDRGCRVERSKVGEANVVDMMLKIGAQSGGEGSSGGFILPEFNYCRDGILASGLIASILDDAIFEELLNKMKEYHRIRKKLIVNSSQHDIVIEKILERLSKEASEVDTLDGIKIINDEDSWVLIRKSNTEDAIRVSSESDKPDKCKENIKRVLGLVNQYHEQVR